MKSGSVGSYQISFYRHVAIHIIACLLASLTSTAARISERWELVCPCLLFHIGQLWQQSSVAKAT